MSSYIYEDLLESERLLTRKLTLEDVKAWSVFFHDKEGTRFLPTYGMENDPQGRAKHWIDRQLHRYDNQLFGLQALIHKNTKEFVGMCGLIQQEVEGIKELEVGYHLFKQHRGNGYASEAAKLFKEYAFTNQISPSIVSIIHIDNSASQAVALKNDMIRERQCKYMDLDVFIYRTGPLTT